MPKELQNTDSDTTESLQEPSTRTEERMSLPWQSEEPVKNRRRLIIALIIAVAIIFGIGGFTVYALWYQSSEKIVMDAIGNALSAKTFSGKGSVHHKGSGFETTLSFDGSIGYKEGGVVTAKYNTKNSNDLETAGAINGVMNPSGNIYLKANHLMDIYLMATKQNQTNVSEFESLVNMQTISAFDFLIKPIIEKIDDKWVKFGAEDMRMVDSTFGDEYECKHKVITSLESDTHKLKQIAERYQENKVIRVKETLPAQEGSVGYVINIDQTMLKNFMESLQSTKFYTELQACSKNGMPPFDEDVADLDKLSSSRTELWIDQTSRQLTRIKSTSTISRGGDKESTTFDMKTKINTPVKVTEPKDFVPFKEALPTEATILNYMSLRSMAP